MITQGSYFHFFTLLRRYYLYKRNLHCSRHSVIILVAIIILGSAEIFIVVLLIRGF